MTTIATNTTLHEQWSKKMLPWHHKGDPKAEAVITLLLQQGLSLQQPTASHRLFACSGNSDCIEFLREVETVHSWVDFDLMRFGGQMNQRYLFIRRSSSFAGGKSA